MKITKMELKDFAGIKKACYDFSESTVVYGRNGSGKTTMKNAYAWCLGKNAGINPFPVKDGENDYTASPEVIVTFQDSKSSYVVRRSMSCSAKNGIIKTSSEFSINDVVVKEKEFGSKLFVEMGLTPDCLNFVLFPEDFFIGKIADRQNALAAILSGEIEFSDYSKTKSKLEYLKKMIKSIGKEIEQNENYLPKIEIADIEKLEKDFEAQKDILSKSRVSDGEELKCLEAQKKKMELEKRLIDVKTKLNSAISRKELLQETININNDTLKKYDSKIKSLKDDLQVKKSEYAEIKSKSWENKNNYCAVCGQLLPEYIKKDALEKFEKNKDKEMKRAIKEGFEIKKEIEEITKKTSELGFKNSAIENDIVVKTQEITEFKGTIAMIEDDIKKIKVDTVNVSDNQNVVTEIEGKLAIAKENAKKRKDIQDEIERLKTQYSNFVKNAETVELESVRFLEDIEKKINDHFSIVKWKMFKRNQNGDIESTAIPLVDGVDFCTSLNNGSKINAIVDAYNVITSGTIPLFLDNAEAVTNWKVKPMGQVIKLCVKNCELTLMEE